MKKNFMSVIMICTILLGTIFILTGCKGRPSDKEFIAEGIKLYEQIFNDKFTLVEEVRGGNGTWGEFGTLDEGKKEIIVKSDKYPDKEINMSFFYDTKTKKYRTGMTNYNFIRYEEQINKDLEKVSKLYTDYKIYVSAEYESVNNCDYKEYIGGLNNIHIDLCVAPGIQYNQKEDVKKLVDILKENGISISTISIYYFKDNDKYLKIKNIKNSEDFYKELERRMRIDYDNIYIGMHEPFEIDRMYINGSEVEWNE